MKRACYLGFLLVPVVPLVVIGLVVKALNGSAALVEHGEVESTNERILDLGLGRRRCDLLELAQAALDLGKHFVDEQLLALKGMEIIIKGKKGEKQ